MKTPLEKALDFTLKNEGGYSNHPLDRGGPTNWGITLGDLSRHRGHVVSAEDVKRMPKSEALEIYSERYWKPLGCGLISNDNVATAIFDIGVVRGIGIPPLYAQKICNANGSKLTVDGKIGPFTAAAINEMDPKKFIEAFASKAEAGFRDIVARKPSQAVFLKGWVNRAKRLLTLSAAY